MAELARSETIALLCYEIDPAEYHRSLLAEALAARVGLVFTDLGGPGSGQRASMIGCFRTP